MIMTIISEESKTRILQKLVPIAPQWAKVLQKQDGEQTLSEPNGEMRIYSLANCIVGEAHGNGYYSVESSKKWCRSCDIVGNRLLSIAYPNDPEHLDARTGNTKHDQAWLELAKFTNHFNKEHKKK